jgi:hypothetical protein
MQADDKIKIRTITDFTNDATPFKEPRTIAPIFIVVASNP